MWTWAWAGKNLGDPGGWAGMLRAGDILRAQRICRELALWQHLKITNLNELDQIGYYCFLYCILPSAWRDASCGVAFLFCF